MARQEGGRTGRLFTLLLFLVVCYFGVQIWEKRHRSTASAPMAPVTTPALPRAAAPPPPSMPRPPVAIKPGPPLVPTPQALAVSTLSQIHQLITQGAAAEAEARLSGFPPGLMKDPQIRADVAVLWNNLGLLKTQQRDVSAGVPAFRTALSLNPTDPTAHLNLLYAYWQLKDPDMTRAFVEQVVRLNPTNPLPHLALADILYDGDDLQGATEHLDHAIQWSAAHPELREYIAMVSARVKRAEQAEQRFSSRRSEHFTVKFNGGEDYAVWDRVLRILEDAYREIGQKFNYYPSQPMVVVLHTQGTFQQATGSPAWADGLYDGVLGRIQIPTQGALTDEAWLTRVLRHEYVHALLHDRTGGNIRAVPQWLNEGLAMQLAGDPWPDIDQIARRAGGREITLVPLNYLEGGWTGLPANAAMVAYLEGNSATGYLIDRFGIGKVQDLIENLAQGQHISMAIKDRLYITYEQFQDRWTEHLNDKIRLGIS